MRELIPGHKDPFDAPSTSDWIYTCPRAEILDVDTETGTCTIQFEATLGQRNDVGIMIPYLSYNKRVPNLSSWIRVMPQIGDLVLINFDPNGTPYIIGYDTQHYETLQGLNPTDYPGFIFRQLKPGEIELRSSGMAGVFFSRGGTNRLFAGDQFISLDKNNREIISKLGLYKLESDYTVIRMGDAKRVESALDFTESYISDSFFNQMKEVDFKVSQNVAFVERPVARWSIGNVVNETLTGGEELKVNNKPVRHFTEIFDPTGLTTAYQEAIDYNGNAVVEFGPLATSGLQVSGITAPIAIDNKSLDWSCLTGVNVSTEAGGINLSATTGGVSATATAGNAELKTSAGTANVDGLSVKLGNSALSIYPVIKGSLLLTALTTFGNALNAYAAALDDVAPGSSTIMNNAVTALISSVTASLSFKTFTE